MSKFNSKQWEFDVRDARKVEHADRPVRRRVFKSAPMPLTEEQVVWAMCKQTNWFSTVLVQDELSAETPA